MEELRIVDQKSLVFLKKYAMLNKNRENNRKSEVRLLIVMGENKNENNKINAK